MVVSASLVAVTVSVPAAVGAVYKPDAVIFPSAAVQVTAVLVVPPLTVAANCRVPLVDAVAELGETATEVTPEPDAEVIFTVAVPLTVVFAALVAVTVSVPAAAGAVYAPVDVMVPSLAFQVTAVFVVPETVAAKVAVPFGASDAVAGATFTVTPVGGAGGAGAGAVVVTTICADADLAGSAMLVAVTVSVPATVGAV